MLAWFTAIVVVVILGVVFRMAQEIERLREEVSQIGSAVDSAVLLLNGLGNRVRELAMVDDDDELREELGALADDLDANSSRLAAAVAANTVAEDDSDTIDADGNELGEDPSSFDESELGSEPVDDNATENNDSSSSSETTDASVSESSSSDILSGGESSTNDGTSVGSDSADEDGDVHA